MHYWRMPLTQIAQERDKAEASLRRHLLERPPVAAYASARTRGEVNHPANGGFRVSACCRVENRPNEMRGSL